MTLACRSSGLHAWNRYKSFLFLFRVTLTLKIARTIKSTHILVVYVCVCVGGGMVALVT